MTSGPGLPEGRVAALMLAHEQDAEAIASRARLIRDAVDAVYIHYDGRAPDETYANLRAALAGAEGIFVLEQRVAVHWGGDDMLLAMLALLDAARAEAGIAAFAYVSTSHYPIKDRAGTASLLATLEGRSGRESKPMPARQVFKRLILPFDKHRRATHLSLAGLARNLASLAAFFSRHGRPRWGSQWIVVARADLPAIDRARPAVEAGAYAHWKILDEVFFQTVLRRSGRDFLSTYFAFEKGNTGSPESLSIEQARQLALTDMPHIFARKVAPGSERTLSLPAAQTEQRS